MPNIFSFLGLGSGSSPTLGDGVTDPTNIQAALESQGLAYKTEIQKLTGELTAANSEIQQLKQQLAGVGAHSDKHALELQQLKQQHEAALLKAQEINAEEVARQVAEQVAKFGGEPLNAPDTQVTEAELAGMTDAQLESLIDQGYTPVGRTPKN